MLFFFFFQNSSGLCRYGFVHKAKCLNFAPCMGEMFIAGIKDKCYYSHETLPLVRNQKYLAQLSTKDRCLKKCKKKNVGSPDV